MENSTNTHIGKNKVMKIGLKVLPPIVCFAATPVAFYLGFDRASVFTMWGLAEYPDSGWYIVPPLVAIVFGIGWTVFAVIGWRRGNIALRIGLSAVVWAFVAGVVLSYYCGIFTSF